MPNNIAIRNYTCMELRGKTWERPNTSRAEIQLLMSRQQRAEGFPAQTLAKVIQHLLLLFSIGKA